MMKNQTISSEITTLIADLTEYPRLALQDLENEAQQYY